MVYTTYIKRGDIYEEAARQGGEGVRILTGLRHQVTEPLLPELFFSCIMYPEANE